MIVLDLKLLVLLGVLALAGTALLAVTLDRRRFKGSLLAHTSDEIDEIRRALEIAPFGLMLLDVRLECVYANAYARRLLKIQPELRKLPETTWRAELYRDLSAARLTDIPQPHYRILNLPSEQSLSWWTCTLPSLNVVILADLSAQHKLEKTSRLFLGSLSHELRTPLTAILVHLEVLRTPGIPDPVHQNSLNLIHQETKRLGKLVQGLLELSHLETTLGVSLRPANLLIIAEEAIAEIILEAEARQILISLEAKAPLPKVLGDPDQLKQVFLNLLDNAVKFCRSGDRIEVCLEKRTEGICATLRDTGPGIPPEHLPHVTERLYRVRTDVPGSGLGLALVAEILRHHNSRLEIESHTTGEHTGTTAWFVLAAA